MKPNRRRALGLLLLLGPIFPACRGGHDRQMVYTAPRVAPLRVDDAQRAGGKFPISRPRVPPRQQIPASNGVDVPIFEPG